MAEKRNWAMIAVPAVIWLIVMGLIYYFQYHSPGKDIEWDIMGLVGGTLALLLIPVGMMSTYAGDNSKLYGLKPIIDRFPAIKRPEGHVRFRDKMLWTIGILIIYFGLTNVMIFGLGESMDLFSEFRAIMAGANGSIMHLGIGPIVTGSIIMQLFTGAKIINLDLTRAEDKAIYQGTQKVLVIVMILVESIPQVYGYLQPDQALKDDIGLGWARAVIVLQLFVGSYLVFLMDEVVSKWGIGSGISMFIAAGVSQAIFAGTLNWLPLGDAAQNYNYLDPDTPAGTLPKTWWMLTELPSRSITTGYFENMFISPPNPIIALISTIVIFLVVAYAESSRIELPLAHGNARGARGRYPLRLIYASNIPVILMAALLANVNMFALLFWSHPSLKEVPLLGHNWRIGFFEEGGTSPIGGATWYISRVNGVHSWLLPLMNWERYQYYTQDHELWQVMLHVVCYLGVMVAGSVMFAKFWIETTNMGSDAVAKQILNSGMAIPKFRRDPKKMKKLLDRYIPSITILSGAFVGLLAGLADMVGTVGQTSGTGVLLTVGIMIRLYEEIGKEQMMEMHPVLRGFFGNE